MCTVYSVHTHTHMSILYIYTCIYVYKSLWMDWRWLTAIFQYEEFMAHMNGVLHWFQNIWCAKSSLHGRLIREHGDLSSKNRDDQALGFKNRFCKNLRSRHVKKDPVQRFSYSWFLCREWGNGPRLLIGTNVRRNVKLVIFHSYISLPEGKFPDWNVCMSDAG